MASNGIPQSALADFRAGTGNVHLRTGFPINLTGLLAYEFFKHFDFMKKLGGGARIDVAYKYDHNNSFVAGALAGEFRKPKRAETVVTGALDWVKHYASVAILDDDFMKNERRRAILEYGDDNAKFEVIYDVYAEMYANMDMAMAEGINAQFLAVPNFSTMEGSATASPTAMYSLWAHLNEDYNGCYGAITAAGARGTSTTGGTDQNTAVKTGGAVGTGVWTTKQGIAVASATYGVIGTGRGNVFAPHVSVYDSGAITGAGTGFSTNHLAMIKSAIRKTNYQRPPMIKRDAKYETVKEGDDLVILTGNRGKLEIDACVLAGQSLWVTSDREDPATTPHFGKAQLRYVPELDTIALYDGASHTTKVTEGASTVDNQGPRFYGVRNASLFPVAFDGNWMRDQMMGRHVNIPDEEVSYLDAECNVECVDYRPQFVVRPSGTSIYSDY